MTGVIAIAARSRRPQSRAKGVHRGFEISIERVSGRNLAFSITGRGVDFSSGFSNKPISPRKFLGELKLWLNAELLKIASL